MTLFLSGTICQKHDANTDGTELPSHWLNAFNVIETRSDEIEPGRLADGASRWTRVPAFLAVLNDASDTVRVISTTSAADGPACVEFGRLPSSVMDYLERCAAPRRENGVTSVQFIEYLPQKALI